MVRVYNSISIVYAGVFNDIFCDDLDRLPSQLVPYLDQSSWINIYYKEKVSLYSQLYALIISVQLYIGNKSHAVLTQI